MTKRSQMKRLLLALVTLALVFSTNCFAGNIEVSNLTAEVMKHDSSGNMWIGIKATITNNGDSPRVMVRIQAFDKIGQTLKVTGLKGTIPPGATGELTNSLPMSEFEYNKITEWKVVD